jgi:hypothetical protein
MEILSRENQEIVIDYVVYFLNSKNKHSKKVYKIGKYYLEKDKNIKIIKSHLFNNFTTRTIYKGNHKIELQIN